MIHIETSKFTDARVATGRIDTYTDYLKAIERGVDGRSVLMDLKKRCPDKWQEYYEKSTGREYIGL